MRVWRYRPFERAAHSAASKVSLQRRDGDPLEFRRLAEDPAEPLPRDRLVCDAGGAHVLPVLCMQVGLQQATTSAGALLTDYHTHDLGEDRQLSAPLE